MTEHARDPYVKKARQEQYRSRAAFKLIQIQKKFHLIRSGNLVLDLGAAPGGWSQVAAEIVGKQGRIVAVDQLKIDPIPGVTVLQGDFLENETLKKIHSELGERKADIILSDMAPNTSGISSLDHDRSILLVESVVQVIPMILRPGGGAVLKVFQGKELKKMTNKALSLFEKGKVFKPEASRSRSVETYFIGKGYRGNR